MGEAEGRNEPETGQEGAEGRTAGVDPVEQGGALPQGQARAGDVGDQEREGRAHQRRGHDEDQGAHAEAGRGQ